MTFEALKEEVERLVTRVVMPALERANENENGDHVHDPTVIRDDIVSLVAGYLESAHGSEATNVLDAHASVRTSTMYARIQHALSTEDRHQCQCGCPTEWAFYSESDRKTYDLGDRDYHDCDHCLDGGGH